MHGNALFDQPVEEHAPMRGLAAVEPKSEFVEIGLQVFLLEGSLVRAHQPALNQRGDAVYTRQDLVGIFAGAFDGRSMVEVFVFGCAWVGCQPVGVDGRARFDMLLNKRLERFGFGVGDDLQPATPETLGGKQLHGDGDQHLASGTAPALAVPDATKDSLIHFDMSGQHVVPRMADCAPETVQHRPSGRVGAETKDPMQCHGGNAILGEGKMPGSGKPDGKRRSGAVKDCPRRAGYTGRASLAPPPTAFHAPRRGASTIRANKAVWPANPIEIVEAGGIIWEPRLKFCVVAWVVDPGAGRDGSNLRSF